jgi:hypothetical protein
MRLRRHLPLLVVSGLLALPAAAGGAGSGPTASAAGGMHWTIELPNPFGVEVENRTLAFDARRYADGSVDGRFEYHQVVEGTAFVFNVDVTCFRTYDGNRAKIGGVIVRSNDATQPPGRFAWFQVFDEGEGAGSPPDRSSLVGFGDEAANEAFCDSPALPRFGPWDVYGNAQVRG